jgi:Recombination endonuclease VII
MVTNRKTGKGRWPDGHRKNYMPTSKEQRRKKYAENSEHRQRLQESNRRYYAAHRSEINARRRRRRASDPEYRARCSAARANSQRAKLLKRFGMSWREYELRLARQNGACAICKKKPKRRFLCIDHCHKTGKVRGLLCTQCNAALGAFGDDPKFTQAATDYLTAFYESLKPTGDVMTSTDEQTETGNAGGLMRKAILLELQCEPGETGDGAPDKLRMIVRKLVDKAAEGDIQAIKEVLDRIDGKSVPGTDDAGHGPRQVNIRWKKSNPVASRR